MVMNLQLHIYHYFLISRVQDVYWHLLLINTFFADTAKDFTLSLNRAYKPKEYAQVDMATFFLQSLQQTAPFTAPTGADPITIICGMVAHWTGFLLQTLETQGIANPLIRPEVCCPALRTLSTVVGFLTVLNEDTAQAFTKFGSSPKLPITEEFSTPLVAFVVRFCFDMIRLFPTSKRCDISLRSSH